MEEEEEVVVVVAEEAFLCWNTHGLLLKRRIEFTRMKCWSWPHAMSAVIARHTLYLDSVSKK